MKALQDVEGTEAFAVAERIRKCFADIAYPKSGKQTVSLGVTQAGENDTLDALCTREDMALNEAKESGKNKAVVIQEGTLLQR